MTVRRSPVLSSWLLAGALALWAAVGSGCQIGPGALKVANAHYSDAVRVSQSEQLLVNLVRLRYRDQPVFLAVSNISTQFELTSSANVSGSIPDGGPNVLGLGAGIDYSERPTISFSIMGGETFQKNMLQPISVPAVALLAESGWRGDRILRLTAEALNGLKNAPRASGPTPSTSPSYLEFLEAVSLIEELSREDLIEFEFETRTDAVSDPIPVAQLEAADLVDAAKAGIEFTIDEAGETATLVVEKRRLVMRFSARAETSPRVRDLREMLSLEPTSARVDVVELEDSDFDPFFEDRRLTELGINTRSLMGVLYYLSNGVQPPPEHFEAGWVTNTVDASGNPFGWNELLDGLFRVHSSSSRPKNAAVAVRHRGQWFYIDDSDETSKSTFLLLGQIFTLQAGDVAEVKPVLTLPVG